MVFPEWITNAPVKPVHLSGRRIRSKSPLTLYSRQEQHSVMAIGVAVGEAASARGAWLNWKWRATRTNKLQTHIPFSAIRSSQSTDDENRFYKELGLSFFLLFRVFIITVVVKYQFSHLHSCCEGLFLFFWYRNVKMKRPCYLNPLCHS